MYLGAGHQPPAELDRHIVPHAVLWTYTRQISHIQPGDLLRVRTNCSGILTWQVDEREGQTAEMRPAGGVMASVTRYNLTLGPLSPGSRKIRFQFTCTYKGCPGQEICCEPKNYTVNIE